MRQIVLLLGLITGMFLSLSGQVVQQGMPLTATQSQNNITCNTWCNGTATVTASGGTAPYTYSWAPTGGNGATASSLCQGTYTCTIVDNVGGQVTCSFNITQPPAISIVPSQTNILCNGTCTGQASVTVTGGTGIYYYAWTPNIAFGALASGLCAGTYTCTVSSPPGCTAAQMFFITQASAISVTTTQTNVACNGANSGNAMVTVTGGTPPYTYSWSSGGSSATESGLGAGTYTCLISDNNGCTTTRTVTITEPPPFTQSAAQTDLTCFGANDGAINLIVSGGTLPYTFDWNSGMYTTEDLSGLTAGTYSVVLTDANGCTLSTTMTVLQPSQITENGIVSDASSCTSSDGMIDLTTIGGTGTFTFAWSNAATTEDISGLDGGIYFVTITDSSGCVESATFTITEPGAPTVTYGEPIDTGCGGSLPTPPFALSGETPTGGTWTGPGVSGNTFDASLANIGMNTIIYSYTDINGCSAGATDSIYVDLCMDVTPHSARTPAFTLFPNPTSGVVSIITNDNYSTIIITNTLGQPVMIIVSNSTTTEVDLSKHADGLYFVRVEQNGNITTQKVLLEK